MDITLNVEHEIVRLLQITDTHLFKANDGGLLSVNTAESFAAVVDAVCAQKVEFDAVIATGDISQDHSLESYQRFIDGIAPLEKPCFWLPGNHDYKLNMKSLMPSSQVYSTQSVSVGEHWQIVLLDSQAPNVPHGRLSDEQLDVLRTELNTHQNRHILVLLHHHPLLVGSEWLDQHTLKNADQFWEIIREYNHVRGVVCGHVHQEMEKQHCGLNVFATPSTCVQFKPVSNEFALDLLSPGWREFELHPNGEIKSQVKRLVNGRFLPDFTASGY